jgi:hypothetical protein
MCESLVAGITETGSIYVFNHGLVDFHRLHRLNEASAIFVTRIKIGMKLGTRVIQVGGSIDGPNLRPDRLTHEDDPGYQCAVPSRSRTRKPWPED